MNVITNLLGAVWILAAGIIVGLMIFFNALDTSEAVKNPAPVDRTPAEAPLTPGGASVPPGGTNDGAADPVSWETSPVETSLIEWRIT